MNSITRLEYGKFADGKFALVEWRENYDPLVILNTHADAQQRAFQAVVIADNHALLLRDYRVPATGIGSGQLRIAVSWHEHPGDSGNFKAEPKATSVECQLVSRAAWQRDNTTTLRAATQ